MNTVQQQEHQGMSSPNTSSLTASSETHEDVTGQQQPQQHTLEGDKANADAAQQQLIQQQLQILQMQQQQLQSMSPSDLSAITTMAHQMALGMVMMPMMPLMMMNANGQSGQSSPHGDDDEEGSPDRSSELGHAAGAEGLGVTGADGSLQLMGSAGFAMGDDDTPKRKRGRPAKKDMMTRPGQPGDKSLKQFPVWGYGMPLPFLPGFMPNAAGALGSDQAASASQDEQAGKEDDQAGVAGKGNAKKKSRGTGRPRGRPRTRPRPGEVIRRVKPPPIAPASFPGMQEYLMQKMVEMKAAQATGNQPGPLVSGDDSRLGSLGTSLLPGEHE
ncbi:hypothetical protein PINS_up010584 [Pythium insidiosum]|nr:hypothetical protein PINS_up010584 [Pythium insidiosum]